MKYTLVTVTLNIQSSDLRPQQNSHPSSPSLPLGGRFPRCAHCTQLLSLTPRLRSSSYLLTLFRKEPSCTRHKLYAISCSPSSESFSMFPLCPPSSRLPVPHNRTGTLRRGVAIGPGKGRPGRGPLPLFAWLSELLGGERHPAFASCCWIPLCHLCLALLCNKLSFQNVESI